MVEDEETPAKAEDALEAAMAKLEDAAARRGLHLTLHALNQAKEVMKWELAGDREKAMEAGKGPPPTDKTRRQN
jgi:hypothetical protein